MSESLRRITEAVWFQNTVIAVILGSVLLLGLETYPGLPAQQSGWLQGLESLVLGLFVVEQALRIGAHGARPWRYFANGWNVFDFLIVAVCFLPGSQYMAALRLVRILRVLRLLAVVQAAEIQRLRNVELAEAYRRLEEEKATSERLLLNVLPYLIAQRLKGGNKIIADSYPDVSVMFADIVGFTHLSSQLPPEQLVEILDAIFSRFDTLVERHGLEKIKTIGDAYMVVAGVPEPHPQPLQAVVDMALEMLAGVEDFNRHHQQNLQLRIGIHCGPVVAGVIGQKKFIYDLWGDTVNVASRMESHGEPGKIHITAAACERLRGSYRWESRGLISVKGKGLVETCFVLGKCAP